MNTPEETTSGGTTPADGTTEGTAGAGKDLRVLQEARHRWAYRVVRTRQASAHSRLPQLPGQAGGLLARHG